MKKYLYILLFVLSGMFLNAYADTINVGTGASTSLLPLGNYYNYAYCAELITAAELGNQNMSISSVGWHPTGNNATASPYKIYLKETTLTTLTADTWANMISGATLLYDSTILVTGSNVATVWFTFPLTSTFTHTNTNNLLVLVESNPGVTGPSQYTPYCYYSTATFNAVQGWTSTTTTPPAGVGALSTSRPNVQLTFTITSPSAPVAATLVSPTNNALGQALTVNLAWSAPTIGQAPTGYKISFGTDTAASNIASGYDIGNLLSFSSPALVNGTTYYWKIVPYNATGDAPNCPIWSFMTIVAAVTNMTPANGTTVVANGTPLSWTASTGASTYQVYFSTAANPTTLVQNTSATTYTPNLASNTTYYWKVTPSASGTPGVVSPIYSFTSALLPAIIGSPANGATTTVVTANLVWYAPAGATSYDVYFGTTLPTTPNTNVTTTTWTPPTMAPSTTYYWKIVPRNTAGTAPNCPTWSFTTTIAPPYVSANPFPANGATGVISNPVLTWDLVAGATSYDVYLGATLPTSVTANVTTNAYTPGILLPSTTYNWKVVPKNSAGGAVNAPVWIFITGASPGTPATPYPGHMNTFMPINMIMTWSAVTGATSYDVSIWGSSIITATVYTNSFTPPAPFAYSGTYYWTVTARNSFGPGIPNSTWWFQTALGPATAPVPADAATGVFVNSALSWTGGGLAYSYDVYFGTTLPTTLTANTSGYSWTPPTMTVNTTYQWKIVPRYNTTTAADPAICPVWSFTTAAIAPPALSINPVPANAATAVSLNPVLGWDVSATATSYDVYFAANTMPTIVTANVLTNSWTPPGPLNTGTIYRWKVVPKNAGGNALNPVAWSFTTGTVPPAATTPSPATGATNVALNPTLGWAVNATATSYDVYFGSPLPTIVTANVATNSWTPPTLNIGTVYQWKILGRNSYGPAISGTTWSFTTVNVPGVAILSTPANNATTTLITATLNWYAVTGATSYDVYFGTTLPGSPNANITTLSWTPPTMNPLTTYVWMIVPRNAQGPAINCPTWTFTTTSAPPNASANPIPANAATGIVSNPVLGWDLVTGATSYDVYIGTTLPTTATANVTTNAYTPAVLLPSSTYSWKVVPKNAGGGAVSVPTWTFTTGASPGTPTTPYPGHMNTFVPVNLTMTWSAVSGSTSYDVSIWGNNTITATVYTNSFTPPAPFAYSGTYYWTVTPRNAFGPGIANSTWWFQTALGPATVPVPADLATGVFNYQPLSWTGGGLAYSYDVYFGTTLPGTRNANPSGTTWTPPTMSLNTTYLWKIVPRYNTTTAADPAICPTWSFTTSSIAPPALATTPSPATTATGVMTNVVLGWGTVTDATNYDVYFGTTLPTTVTANVTTNSWTPLTTLNPSTTYSWKVVPKGLGGTAQGTPTTWTFTTGAAPTVATNPIPTQLAINVLSSTSLSWTAVATATSYDVYFGTTLPSTPNANVTSPTWTPPTLTAGTPYQWKVVPINAYGPATGNPLWVFTTLGLPTPATSPVPADLATGVAVNASLSWAAVATATSYDVYFGTTLPGIANANVATPSWTPPTMANGTLYQWMVVPMNSIGSAIGAPTWSFTTIIAPPLAAINPVPADLATGVAINAALSWDPVATATSYDVYFGTTLPGTPNANVLTPTWTPPTMLNNTVYSWMVIPRNAGGSATGNATWSFTTIVALPLAATTPVPADLATSVLISSSLSWGAVATATSYDVYFGTTLPGVPNANVLTPTWTPPTMAYSTVYQWMVIPRNAAGSATGNATWSFTTEAAPFLPIPTGVTLVQNLVTAVLNWTAVSGATSYNIYTSADPIAVAGTWTLAANVLTNTYTDSNITAGDKFYQVTAVNSLTESARSVTTGYVKYTCTTNTSGGLNLIALPLSQGYINASDLGNAIGIDKVDNISKWDNVTQTWSSAYYLFGSWYSDFALSGNDIVLVNFTLAAGGSYDYYSMGSLPANPVFTFPTSVNGGLNMMFLPLNMATITTASALGTSIGNTNTDAISQWDTPTQTWSSAYYLFGSWYSDFPISIGKPLMVNILVNGTVWPVRYTPSAPHKTTVNRKG